MTQHGQEWDAPGPQGYCMQRDKENSLLHIGRQSTNNYIFLPVLMLLVPLFLPWSYLMDTSIQSGVRGSSWWNVRQRMDRPRLFNWMMQLFVKHIPPTRPVMLFVDGHSLHYGPETIQAAAEAEIMIFLSSLNSCGLARVANSIAVCTCLCKIVNGLRNHKKLAKSWLYIYSGLELKKGGGWSFLAGRRTWAGHKTTLPPPHSYKFKAFIHKQALLYKLLTSPYINPHYNSMQKGLSHLFITAALEFVCVIKPIEKKPFGLIIPFASFRSL